MIKKRYYVILRSSNGNEVLVRTFSKRRKAVMYVMNEIHDGVATLWSNSNGDVFYNVIPHPDDEDGYTFIIRKI